MKKEDVTTFDTIKYYRKYADEIASEYNSNEAQQTVKEVNNNGILILI